MVPGVHERRRRDLPGIRVRGADGGDAAVHGEGGGPNQRDGDAVHGDVLGELFGDGFVDAQGRCRVELYYSRLFEE